ncbi:hypothetical protein Tco_1329849 [Tanacetum coccineum]
MLTMAENVIATGADNRPPMLDKSQYSSWRSRMLLYIKGKEHGENFGKMAKLVPYLICGYCNGSPCGVESLEKLAKKVPEIVCCFARLVLVVF